MKPGTPQLTTLTYQGTTVGLGPDIDETIEQARKGDPRAWGDLYGQAGALVAAQLPFPEPLASVIAGRLAALNVALASSDGRRAVRRGGACSRGP
jgi:hypothetical protein